MNDVDLLKQAIEVMPHAYASYSHFPVGAALLLADGTVITGVNVENASFGVTICAEQNAITTAITQGYQAKDFKKLAVCSNMKNITPPCGICRQMMSEFFSQDVLIIMGNKQLDYQTVTINELLPYSFTKQDLKELDD